MEHMQESASHISFEHVDEIDRVRAQEYALLATLPLRSPDTQMIGRLALLRGEASPLGVAHTSVKPQGGRMKTIWGGSISISLLGSEAACYCRTRLTT